MRKCHKLFSSPLERRSPRFGSLILISYISEIHIGVDIYISRRILSTIKNVQSYQFFRCSRMSIFFLSGLIFTTDNDDPRNISFK